MGNHFFLSWPRDDGLSPFNICSAEHLTAITVCLAGGKGGETQRIVVVVLDDV